eukprot:403360643
MQYLSQINTELEHRTQFALEDMPEELEKNDTLILQPIKEYSTAKTLYKLKDVAQQIKESRRCVTPTRAYCRNLQLKKNDQELLELEKPISGKVGLKKFQGDIAKIIQATMKFFQPMILRNEKYAKVQMRSSNNNYQDFIKYLLTLIDPQVARLYVQNHEKSLKKTFDFTYEGRDHYFHVDEFFRQQNREILEIVKEKEKLKSDNERIKILQQSAQKVIEDLTKLNSQHEQILLCFSELNEKINNLEKSNSNQIQNRLSTNQSTNLNQTLQGDRQSFNGLQTTSMINQENKPMRFSLDQFKPNYCQPGIQRPSTINNSVPNTNNNPSADTNQYPGTQTNNNQERFN